MSDDKVFMLALSSNISSFVDPENAITKTSRPKKRSRKCKKEPFDETAIQLPLDILEPIETIDASEIDDLKKDTIAVSSSGTSKETKSSEKTDVTGTIKIVGEKTSKASVQDETHAENADNVSINIRKQDETKSDTNNDIEKNTNKSSKTSKPKKSGNKLVDEQIKSRERVRDLAEVYTHKREVNAMLDLVSDMFPNSDNLTNIDRTFLEPACGSGNFLVEILRRKLAHLSEINNAKPEILRVMILRAVSSIYGVDIDESNVEESRARMKAIAVDACQELVNTFHIGETFRNTLDAILETNILLANTLTDGKTLKMVSWTWDNRNFNIGYLHRTWYTLEGDDELASDDGWIHYQYLADYKEAISIEKLKEIT